MRLNTLLSIGVTFLIGAIFSSFVTFAWTGPSGSAPSGNVSAPLNVGTTDQTKNAGLGVNSLAVFGNAIISTVGGYLNFGTTAGASGYGIRDNGGTMEVKNNTGSWSAIATSSFGGGGSFNYSGLHGQIFTSSGTFTVPVGVTAVKAVLIGGGGGSTFPGCVSGGGAGGTATKWVTGLSGGSTLSVIVGAGGVDSNGGASSFAGVTAYGGSSPTTGGGAGGSTSGADLSVTGGSGGNIVCAFGAAIGANGLSNGEYSNTIGYHFGRGSGNSGPPQPGVVIIQW